MVARWVVAKSSVQGLSMSHPTAAKVHLGWQVQLLQETGGIIMGVCAYMWRFYWNSNAFLNYGKHKTSNNLIMISYTLSVSCIAKRTSHVDCTLQHHV